MKVLLSWLRELVDIPWSVGEMAERLPMLGIGVDAVEAAGDDAVFDLEIPANRGDLMSHLGVARELAAATGGVVRVPAAEPVREGPPTSAFAQVEVREPALCPRFTAAVITDVRVGPSPEWMARRLEACGVRSINTVVDVTNYVMLELGQPMHAFDYDRIRGGRLVVRLARPGERLVTLDGVERTLDDQVLVVADAERAVGIAGVIGGADTEIRPDTRRVLLEAAAWHPPQIRRTSKRLGVRTESSARFERGVDVGAVAAASARAQRLLQEVAGGRVLPRPLDLYPHPQPGRTVDLAWGQVRRLLGVEIDPDEGAAILTRLGFGVRRAGERVVVQVPSFRRDVERAEDVIEEVARHHGYDRIPETLPLEVTSPGSRAPVLRAEAAVREILIRCGLTEALTISLTHPRALDRLRLPPEHPWRQMVALRNPLVDDHTHLRTTLLVGLLDAARANVSRRVTDVPLFEIGRTFHPAGDAVAERRRLGVVMTGRLMAGAWNLPEEAVRASYYHLKGVIEALLDELRIAGAEIAAAEVPWLRPGRAARLVLDGEEAGSLGELHPEVAAAFDLPDAVYVAHLDLEAILARAVFSPRFSPPPRFPAVRRDLAVVVAADVPAADVRRVIADAAGPYLEAADLFDVYTGPPVPPGHRSLAYALTFRSPERTLSADDVDAAVAAVAAALAQRLRAVIR
ncbi:MAG: phenylalanine--tRNA ligase subunit beta [Armatimonadota bacterium]|nr:phenylalanine--tRNA ligase subunit beta [Armatimonadota bacterium]MDR7437054.1 phenylalanine--tRNA ligase subunit beta [Armatimonadota bacterium]MDR7472875.1 phenylalanine--tRNA ligase subunit beta [Armatimonadota bacterium]MDR7507235.1 phenylalanine--tRNA ligase subunit beta [Armatimonadota bacterium]MDR7508940.1 phenylalanine--tRNA ligase subunit beta [Armatimonadota bacterium]